MSRATDSVYALDSDLLRGKRVILAMTGSVAVLRAVDLARTLMRHGATVVPVMSRAATEMVGPRLLHWATGVEPVVQLTGANEHVEYAGNGNFPADLLLIAPATANTIGKIAAGIDDTAVTTFATTAIGQGIPILLAPAMHEPMYAHPIVLKNLEALREIGVRIVEPQRAEGKAKMASIPFLVDCSIRAIRSKESALAGLHVLVTSGRTVEYLDPVRVVSNNSSGKMGVALARAAFRDGANVTLVYGKGSAPEPEGVDVVRTDTAEQMYDAVISRVTSSRNPVDAVIAAAAVGDWKARSPASEKVSTHGIDSLTVELVPTPKIIDEIKKLRPEIRLVAFRALHGLSVDELKGDAKKRMRIASAELIAVNDVSKHGVGFETDTNELVLIHSDGVEVPVPLTSKERAASIICTELARYF